MSEIRIFHFACKPGCDPVHLKSLTAHARFPWLAQGYQVFEWHLLEDRGKVVMLGEEIDRLYEFCGVGPSDPHIICNTAQIIYDKVAAQVAQLVAP
jgi:hypothetical protein